jgi:hypothetical protein
MTTKEIVDNWLHETEIDLISNYERLGLKASGLWANSLEPFNTNTPTKINAGIKGQKYTGAIEYGRKPNTNQSPESIRKWVGWAGSTIIKKWCQDKGIPKAASYAIAYKIALQGWKVPNQYNAGGIVSDVMTKDRYSDLIKKLSLYYINEIKTDLIDTLKNGNN